MSDLAVRAPALRDADPATHVLAADRQAHQNRGMVSASSSQRGHPAAVAVALITGTMGVVYVLLIRSQGNDPLAWVLAVLGVQPRSPSTQLRLAPDSVPLRYPSRECC